MLTKISENATDRGAVDEQALLQLSKFVGVLTVKHPSMAPILSQARADLHEPEKVGCNYSQCFMTHESNRVSD